LAKRRSIPVSKDKKNHCCDMHKKVGLGIARVYAEEECGVPDSVMVDYHDFNYESASSLPVAAALSFKFCPWCGTARADQDPDRRTTEVVRLRPRT